MRKLCGWLALAGVLLLGGVAEVKAGGIEIQQIALNLNAERSSDMLVVANRDAAPVRFQVTAFSWQQKPDGELVLAPSRDIMFFPAMMTLNPQESRNIRVGVTVKPGAVEKTYRVFIQELPRMMAPGEVNSAAIAMLARISIPVFVEPAAASKPATAFTGLRVEGEQVNFALKNNANVHYRPDEVEVQVKDATGQVVHKEELRAWYVLAGGVLEYSFKLPPPACSSAKSIQLEMKLEKDVVRTALNDVRCVASSSGPSAL
jgi:fimbrial chaperone protein